jgi:hypothetical protein
LDEIDSLNLELANVTVWRRIVDKNKSAAGPTKLTHCVNDSSFYFSVDLIAVL